MRNFPGILIFFIALFAALPTDALLACGNAHAAKAAEKVAAEKSCCKAKPAEEPAHCEADLSPCAQDHPFGQKCPDHKGCCGKGCACPCGTIPGGHSGILLSDISLLLPAFSDDSLRGAFYFAQHMPEEVYLAIWQPPQLSA